MLNAFGREVSFSQVFIRIIQQAEHVQKTTLADSLRKNRQSLVEDAFEFLGLSEQEFEDHSVVDNQVIENLEEFKKEVNEELDSIFGVADEF